MKRIFVILIVLILFLTWTIPGYGIYMPPSRVTPTQEDINVAVNFIKNLKWDLSKASSGQITLTLPKLPKEYTVLVKQRTMDENNGTISGGIIHQGTGGVSLTKTIDEKLRTGFRFDLGNSDTSANIALEFYTYTPGDTTVKYMPFEERRWPVYDENGNIEHWIDDLGNTINEGGTNPNSNDPKPQKPIFSDVKSNFWGYKDITTLAGSGYIKGYPDGTFKPNNKITRAEFMVMLEAVLKDKWADGRSYNHAGEKEIISSSHWSYNAVTNTLKYLPKKDISYIFGSDIRPDQYTTREEVVAVLDSVLSVHKSFQKEPPGNITLSDVNASNFPDSVWFSVRQNLVTGYPDLTFRPQNSITRAEITAVMVRMIEKL